MTQAEQIDIADEVRHKVWGHTGIVGEVYENFSSVPMLTGTHQSWLEAQIVPHTYEEIHFEPWYQVLCHEGGSVIAPKSKLEILKKLEI